MRILRLWKVKKGQVRERMLPGKVLFELRAEFLKNKVDLSGDNSILDRGTTYTKPEK